MLETVKEWARRWGRDAVAVWIASRDPRVPWYAKGVALLVAAYVLSPIDLIPDFIPVLGYVDDLVLVPLGILLVVRLVPAPLMDEFRERAAGAEEQPRSYAGAAAIVLLWVGGAALVLWWSWPRKAV